MSDHQVTDRASLDRASLAKEASPFLTPEQTSFYLGISQRQLQVLRANGKGPRYRRHSRYIRYHIDDLDLWSRDTAKEPHHV